MKKWETIRARGYFHYILLTGILRIGGMFSVGMLIFGYFSEVATLNVYLTSTTTWFPFVFHAIVFGFMMGSLNWMLNEVAFKSENFGK